MIRKAIFFLILISLLPVALDYTFGSSIYPDSGLYPIERIGEKELCFILNLVRANDTYVQYCFSLLSERLSEVDYCIHKELYYLVDDLVVDYKKTLAITYQLVTQNNLHVEEFKKLLHEHEEKLTELTLLVKSEPYVKKQLLDLKTEIAKILVELALSS